MLVHKVMKNTKDAKLKDQVGVCTKGTAPSADVRNSSMTDVKMPGFFETSKKLIKFFFCFWQLHQFSIELLHRDVSFSAWRLFPLNYTLIHSVSHYFQVKYFDKYRKMG